MRTLLLLSLCGLLAAPMRGDEMSIKVPAGMKVVTRQVGDRLEISFVPGSAKGPKSAAGAKASAAAAAAEPAPTLVAAKNPAKDLLKSTLDGFNFDQPIAAAPAFVALGVTPETVARPETPRKFAAGLISGIDGKGKLQGGLAMTAAPMQVFSGDQATYEKYTERGVGGFLYRALWNTSFSLATTRAASDTDKTQRVAAGLSITLWDQADPRMDGAYRKAVDLIRESLKFDYSDNITPEDIAQQEALEKSYPKSLAELRDARKDRWGQSAFSIAWAPVWRTPTGNAGDLRFDGSTAWATLAYGMKDKVLDQKIQWNFHARYRHGERLMDEAFPGQTFKRRTFFGAVSCRFGGVDFNGFVEGAYIRLNGGPEGNRNAHRIAGGFERKIAENLWFVFSAGKEFGRESKAGDALFTMGSFRFGTSEKASFQP